MKILFQLMLILGFASFATHTQAQNITVSAKLDSTLIMIGEQSALWLEVSQLPGENVKIPYFTDTIPGGLEVVSFNGIDTIPSKDGYISIKHQYTITAFEDSLYYVKPFPFVAGIDTFWSKSLSLKVVQPFEIDTASNIVADIKPIYTVPFDWKGLLMTIFFIWLILVIILIIYSFIRKYILKKPIIPSVLRKPEIKRPPYEVAIESLDKIKTEKVWQTGRIKEYHTELTDVLRVYIEDVFNIHSLEMTSDEILEELQTLKASQRSAHEGLKQILQLADLVKFAKWTPSINENELSLLNAYLFVNQTKVEDPTPIEETGKKPEGNNEKEITKSK